MSEHGTVARYKSGCRCLKCAIANSDYAKQRYNDLKSGVRAVVLAKNARKHLMDLKRVGMSLQHVSEACGLGVMRLRQIRNGNTEKIRRTSEALILAVRPDSSGGEMVPAEPTVKLLRELQAEGFTKAELARRLGVRCAKLCFGRKRIRRAVKDKVQAFYDTIMAGA